MKTVLRALLYLIVLTLMHVSLSIAADTSISQPKSPALKPASNASQSHFERDIFPSIKQQTSSVRKDIGDAQRQINNCIKAPRAERSKRLDAINTSLVNAKRNMDKLKQNVLNLQGKNYLKRDWEQVNAEVKSISGLMNSTNNSLSTLMCMINFPCSNKDKLKICLDCCPKGVLSSCAHDCNEEQLKCDKQASTTDYQSTQSKQDQAMSILTGIVKSHDDTSKAAARCTGGDC